MSNGVKLKSKSKLPSKKLMTTAVTGVITYVLVTVLGVDLDEEVRAAISTVVGFGAGYIAPPDPVEAK